MRLYLNAISLNQVGYVPDWLKITYKEGEKELELTLDIQGSIDYDTTKLNCHVKGELIPWVIYDLETGEETDLSSLPNEELEKLYPEDKIIELFKTGYDFRVGLYPADERAFELASSDVLLKQKGSYYTFSSVGKYQALGFEFEEELNVDVA